MDDQAVMIYFCGAVMTPAMVFWLWLNGWMPPDPGMVLYVAAVVFTDVILEGR